jgi:hypothetical protein
MDERRNRIARGVAHCLFAIVLLLFGAGGPAVAADSVSDAPAASLPEPTDPAVRDRERQALITFYEALGGPDWIQRDLARR